MRRRFRNLAAVAIVSMVGLGSAGCGLTDTGAEPGVAASIGEERLALSKVDDAIEDYCALRAGNPQAGVDPTALVRSQFVLTWTQAIAVEHLAPEHDVSLPSGKIDPAEVRRTWGQLGTIDDDNFETFEWLTWLSQRVGDPVLEIGAEDLGAGPTKQVTQEEASQRGLELIDAWLEEHRPHLNPTFGTFDVDYAAQSASHTGDTLSVPVSGEARRTSDTTKLDAAAVADLPASQRCGAVPDPAAQAPGA